MTHQPSKPERFARWLVAIRNRLLILALLAGIVAFWLSRQLSFETSVESMFASDHPQLRLYQEFKRIFGGAEMVLSVYRDQQLLASDGSGLQRLEERTAELATQPGVVGVLSLAEINGALKKVYSLGNLLKSTDNAAPIFKPDDDVAQRFLKIFEGYTHSADYQIVAIVCLLDPADSQAEAAKSPVVNLRRIVEQWPSGQVAGEPVLVEDGFRFLSRDAARLDRNCRFLMAIVIIGCFRSARWVLIPLAVIQLSLLMTHALLVLGGWELTMVSSMLSAIVTVIGVATTVHVTVRFREARTRRRSRISAMQFAFATLSMPIAWACVTDAAGFMALTSASVEPVSDFGWMMALASIAVLASIFLLVPGLGLLGSFDVDPKPTWGEAFLLRILGLSARAINQHAVVLGTLAGLAFVVVACGIVFLEVETDFTKNFRKDSEIIQAYTFVEQELGGAGLIDVIVPSPPTLTREFLNRIDRLQDELRALSLPSSSTPALTHVLSFADADRAVRGTGVLGLLPPEIGFQAMEEVMPTFAQQMRTTVPDENDKTYFRIMLRTKQQKSAKQQAHLIAAIDETLSRHFPELAADNPPMTTGFFVLLSTLVNSVLSDQTKTFVLATLLIATAMMAAFMSIKLAVIALIPNVLPIVALLGSLGWLGIKLNMGAAMIAAVSIGLSIDATIHYLSLYRLNRSAGRMTAVSINRVQQRVGRPVIYSTIALVVGFGSLCTSEFIPTVFFGALVGLSMLGGLFGNLILLPALLTVFDRTAEQPGANSQDAEAILGLDCFPIENEAVGDSSEDKSNRYEQP